MDYSGNPCARWHSPVPRAVTVDSKLIGATQPSLIMATGLRLYVVKFCDFSLAHGLMSEVIGTELMSQMGLPVPEWSPIEFTATFIDDHPEIWYRSSTGGRGIPPRPGIHFGSRLTLSGHGHTYQIIPGAWADRVSNRRDFIGALLLDLWTNNCDRRQCLFVSDNHSPALRAVFIDHDWMFGGHLMNEKTVPRRCMAGNPRLYEGVWTEEVIEHWKNVIDCIDGACLDRIFALVPQEWATPSQLRLARQQLASRKRRLGTWMTEATQVLKSGRFTPLPNPRPALLSHDHLWLQSPSEA